MTVTAARVGRNSSTGGDLTESQLYKTALKLLANLQSCSENFVDTILEGLQEQSSLKIKTDLRRFIEVDNHEAMMIGDLRRTGRRPRW